MTDNMDEIERELSQSRAALKSSVNALGESLSLGQIIDELVEKTGLDFRPVTHAASNAAKLVVPGAVLGAGVALLVSNMRSSGLAAKSPSMDGSSDAKKSYDRYRSAAALEFEHARGENEDYKSYRQRVRPLQADILGYTRADDEDEPSFHDRVEQGMQAIKAASAKMGANVADAAHAALNRAGDAAAETAHAVKEKAGDALDKVSDATSSAKQEIHTEVEKLQKAYSDNPVLGIAAGICVGALVGALLPQGRKEEEVLRKPIQKAAAVAADAGKNLADTARDQVRAVVDRIVPEQNSAGQQA